MYPWLARTARALARLIGVSVLVTGAALVVWLAASALSSPTASAQTVPPPAGGGSTSSAHHTTPTTHPTSTSHSTSSKSSAPSSTPGTVREAQGREAMDNEMYGQPPAKSAAKTSPAKSSPQKTSPAKSATKSSAPSSTPGTVREAQGRQAQDNEMDKAAKAAAAKQAATAKRDAQNRQAQDDEMDRAAKAAAAKQAATAKRDAQNRQAQDDEMDRAAKAAAAKNSAPSLTPGTVREAQGRQAMDNEMYGNTVVAPPKHASTRQIANWWGSFSPTAQQQIITHHSSWIGNLDGIPAWARSKANTIRLPRLINDVKAKAKEFRSVAAKLGSSSLASGLIKSVQASLKAKLDSLAAVQKIISEKGSKYVHQLLLLTIHNRRVEAAISVGNVDTASNVAVLTPGLNTTVNGDMQQKVVDVTNLKATADKVNGYEHDGGANATVVWLGYQAPQTLDPTSRDTASNPDLAIAGGAKLAKFYNGIGATHRASNTPLHLTALGHSYGSTTTGYALSHRTPVTSAVLFGSPGQGAQHLRVSTSHVYAELDAGDRDVPEIGAPGGLAPVVGRQEHGLVGLIAGPGLLGALAIGDNQPLGPSPYSRWGGTYPQLSTAAGHSRVVGALKENVGHSGYLTAGSTSLYNMAAIMTGHPGLAHR